LTIWHSVTRIAPERHGKAQLGHVELDIDFANADLADEWMAAAIAALGRVAERQQEPLVAARQRLQAQVAIEWKVQRLTRQVADIAIGIGLAIGSISPCRPRRSVTRGACAASASRTIGAGTSPSTIEGSSRR
jgi:hypothetical protein